MANQTRGLTLAVLCACVVAIVGCGDDDAMPAEASYSAYNLFTGAPRFAVFKADAARDLCVRVVFIWIGEDGTVDLDEALTEESVMVTHRAADCSPVDGSPPSLEVQGVPAQSISGTATVERHPVGEGDRWTVSIDGLITFPADDDWVPETEPLDAEELEIVGGCC